MSRLLEVYDNMIKEAEVEKMAEEVQTMFAKYAEAADSLLSQEFGKDYDINDVESLAQGLMERDAELLETQEKVAEYDAIGRELAHRYVENTKTGGLKEKLMNKALHVGVSAANHPAITAGVAAGAAGAAGVGLGRLSKEGKE
jgi:hypothetical protein